MPVIDDGEEIMAGSAKRRKGRLELRLTPRAKTMLKRAAIAEEKSVSAFVLDKSLEAAAETLADRRNFVSISSHAHHEGPAAD